MGRSWMGIKSRVDPNRTNDLPSALPAVSLLLSAGADLEAVDAEGMTALHYAATSDYKMPIIALLAAYGAKINAPDRFGRTPLDHAIVGTSAFRLNIPWGTNGCRGQTALMHSLLCFAQVPR